MRNSALAASLLRENEGFSPLFRGIYIIIVFHRCYQWKPALAVRELVSEGWFWEHV
jgi:hypothetical protein